jgi:hypothetical protein
VPRSGSSWLGQLINSHPDVSFRFQPLFSHEFGPHVQRHFSESTLPELFDQIFFTRSSFLNQSERIAEGDYPIFQKRPNSSVLAFKENSYLDMVGQMLTELQSLRAIFLVRDPIKVIESWVSAPREFPNYSSIENEWEWAPSKNVTSRDFFGYRKWEKATQEFVRLNRLFPEQTQVVRYEVLAGSPSSVTRELFDFIGLDFDQQTQSFISASSQPSPADRPYSVFRSILANQIGPYKLNTDIVQSILSEVRRAGLLQFTLEGSESP